MAAAFGVGAVGLSGPVVDMSLLPAKHGEGFGSNRITSLAFCRFH
jgi:hypothetical protein